MFFNQLSASIFSIIFLLVCFVGLNRFIFSSSGPVIFHLLDYEKE